MTETVVTSFSPAGARLYGLRMVQAYRQHWPATVPLVVYLDAPMPLPGVDIRLTTGLGSWQACRARWAADPEAHGRVIPHAPRWKTYHYRRDAARFAVKLFVMRDAAVRLKAGVLTWFDGDTVTKRPIPEGWTTALLGDADVAYLGRGSMHPETGYLGFRIPEALPLLEWCCACYESDRFRALTGWTDCHVVQAALATLPIRARNLTAEAYVGKSNIWPASPLAPYVTHFKGSSQKRGLVKC